MMEGTCATLNSRIQALKLNKYKASYLFEGCYFGAIMGSAKLAGIVKRGQKTELGLG